MFNESNLGLSHSEIDILNQQFELENPQTILNWALNHFGEKLTIATGFGISGIVLMHMVSQIQPQASFFYLQTDLLFPETMALKNRLATEFNITFTEVHSNLRLDQQAKQYGPSLWRNDPDLCCHLRKVDPLRRHLTDKQAWITGLRRDQSPSRAQIKKISWDAVNHLTKLAPLADWSRDQTWQYIRENNLPYNPLHDQGYPSLGCTVCTHKVKSDAAERSGRWAGQEKSECGIHIQPDGTITRKRKS